MNTKIAFLAVLGVAIAMSPAAAQGTDVPLLPGYANLIFDGAFEISPVEYAVNCGNGCDLIADYYVPVDTFAILVGSYDPALPLVWSVLCVEPMTTGNCVAMGGVIPPEFAGCCFAFVAFGLGDAGLAFSDTVVLHTN